MKGPSRVESAGGSCPLPREGPFWSVLPQTHGVDAITSGNAETAPSHPPMRRGRTVEGRIRAASERLTPRENPLGVCSGCGPAHRSSFLEEAEGQWVEAVRLERGSSYQHDGGLCQLGFPGAPFLAGQAGPDALLVVLCGPLQAPQQRRAGSTQAASFGTHSALPEKQFGLSFAR